MAWTQLKNAINNAIKANNNQEITGPVLNSVLNTIVNSVGKYATFAGIATPSTNPGVFEGPTFWIAHEKGIYANFDNATIQKAGIYVLLTKGSNSTDTKNIQLSASAYTDINDINISSGYSILSVGDYNSDIIFCPDSTFNASNTGNVRLGNTSSARAPLVGYTFTGDYHSCRPISDINSIITIGLKSESSYDVYSIIEIDNELSNGSDNPVSNRVIYKNISNLNEIVIGNTDTKNIQLSASAYTDINDINIPSGYSILSVGDYDSDIIFCPDSTFNVSNSNNVRLGNTASAQAPLVGYTFTGDYHSCRPISSINNELVIKTGKEGLAEKVNNLNTIALDSAEKVDNLNEIVIGNTDTKNIQLSASAYGNINNINIPSGYSILSVGDYDSDIIFCPDSTFNVSNSNNVRLGNTASAQAPLVGYTFTGDYHSCRPISSINNELVIKTGKEGLVEKVNNLQPPYAVTPAKVYANTLRANIAINIEKNSIKNAKSISFSAKFTTFSSIKIAHGNVDEYASSHVIVDSTNVYVYRCYTDKQLVQTLPHGLIIKNNIGVVISCDIMGTASLIVTSNGNIFSANITWLGSNGNIAATGINMELSDVVLGFNCYRYNSDIWLFGDSYIDLTAESRWPSYLIKNGYNDILFNAFPGQNSESALTDFNNCISHGKPKIVIWCLGMNDADSSSSVNSSWLRVYNAVKEKCESLGITLILSTVPNVPSRNHSYKNSIIKNSGMRYIDFYNAVGSTANGSWYDGMLSTDSVHPTEKGAVALFSRAVADVPELMSKA